MSWTYDDELADDLSRVRFLIQDTNSARPLCSDGEIQFMISSQANIYMAAAACCDVLVAKAGSLKTRWIGDLFITMDPTFYRGLSASLRAMGAGHQVPFAGGISIADKRTQETDTDAVQPRAFRTGLDNPRADQPTPGGDTSSPLSRTP